MRILLNYPEIKNAYEMAKKMIGWNIIDNIFDSSMENAYNFKFENIDFFILYDENSAKNDKIFQYIIESHNNNAQEGTDEDNEATEKIYNYLKKYISKIMLETDDM